MTADRRSQAAGSLPRPYVLGRIARLLLAMLAGTVFVLVLSARLEDPPGTRGPTLLFLAVAVGAVWALAELTNQSLGRRWGIWPRIVGAGIALVLLVVDLIVYGTWWAPPLSLYLFLLVEVVFGWLTLSLIAAAVVAAPG